MSTAAVTGGCWWAIHVCSLGCRRAVSDAPRTGGEAHTHATTHTRHAHKTKHTMLSLHHTCDHTRTAHTPQPHPQHRKHTSYVSRCAGEACMSPSRTTLDGMLVTVPPWPAQRKPPMQTALTERTTIPRAAPTTFLRHVHNAHATSPKQHIPTPQLMPCSTHLHTVIDDTDDAAPPPSSTNPSITPLCLGATILILHHHRRAHVKAAATTTSAYHTHTRCTSLEAMRAPVVPCVMGGTGVMGESDDVDSCVADAIVS